MGPPLTRPCSHTGHGSRAASLHRSESRSSLTIVLCSRLPRSDPLGTSWHDEAARSRPRARPRKVVLPWKIMDDDVFCLVDPGCEITEAQGALREVR